MPYNERVQITNASLSETLEGSLPPIDLLELDFHYKLDGINSYGRRIKTAISHASAIESSFGLLDGTTIGSLNNPGRDILPILFLDAVKILGEQELATGQLNPKKKTRIFKPEDIAGVLNARIAMQLRINDYLEIYSNSSSATKHEALEAIFYEAGCLLLNRRDHTAHADSVIYRRLCGILAEHKVIDAVQKGGYHMARYGSPEEDTLEQADIVLEADDHNMPVALTLQVKGRSQREASFSVLEDHKGNIIVFVPMHRSLDQFNLTTKQAKLLVNTLDMKVKKLVKFREKWTSKDRS